MMTVRLAAIAALAGASALLMPTQASAADASWVPTAVSGPWSTDANWTPAFAPGAVGTTTNPDTATFGGAPAAARTVTVDANRNVLGITFSGTGTLGYTLQTGPLALTSGGLIQSTGSTGAHTDSITAPIVIQGESGTLTLKADSTLSSRLLTIGAITGASTGTNVSTLTLNGVNTGLNTISGNIGNGAGAGSLGIIKSGTGTWVLSGVNSYSGGTQINAGALDFATMGSVGSGGGTITVAGNATVGLPVGTGRFVAADFDTLFSTGTVSKGGTVPTVTIASNSAVGFDTSNSSLAYSTAIGGSYGVAKYGAANTLTLSGASTYTGPTNVVAGVLAVGSNSALGSAAGGTFVTGGGVVSLTGGITVASEPMTINAVASANAQPNGLSSSTGSNAWNGLITGVGDGSNNFRINSNTLNTTLTLGGGITSTGTFALTGTNATGVVLVGPGNFNVTGNITGAMSLVTTSTGTATLAGNNTFTGNVRMQADGSVLVASSLNSVNGAGTAPVSASSSLGAPASAGAATIVFGAAGASSAALRYVGSGETTNRTIQLNSTGTSTIEQAGTGLLKFSTPITGYANNPATLALSGSTAGAGEFSGNIVNGSGTGITNLAKNGTGAWTLTGASNSYTGTTTVNAGTLIVNSAIAASSGVSLPTANGATLGGTGTITSPISIAGTNVLRGGDGATASDDLAINGNLTMSSGSFVELSFGPGNTHSSITRSGGTFTLPSDLVFKINNLGADVGTYDNIIAGLAADPGVAGWTISGAGWAGTFSYDGGAGAGNVDLNVTAVGVPEPTTLSLFGIAAVGLLARRGRRAKA